MLDPTDWLLISFYFAAIIAIAGYSIWSQRNSPQANSYFLAGRDSGWLIIGCSLFASNIGSEHLIGLAGTAASSGVAVAQFELLASLMLILLGWFFAPLYLKTGVHTMPEFLELRFGSATRWYLAVVSILGYVFTKISVTIAAGALVLETIIGIEFWTGAITLVMITGAYTILGGLKAVMYTDFIQTIVLLLGAILITLLGIDRVGGVSSLIEQTDVAAWSLWRPSIDPDFPWTGILFGAPILGIWYWCTDQFIVQRVLSARNLEQAQKGCALAGFLKILPLFIFVIPGIIAANLANSGQLTMSSPDQALVALMAEVLPSGIRGIVVAGLLSALMSSLSSVFNSCSTLLSYDVFKRLRPEVSDKNLVRFGQWATVGLVIIGLLWIPLMERVSSQIYRYLQSVQAYIAPPITAVFLLGILTKSAHRVGANLALWAGLVVGMSRLVLEVSVPHSSIPLWILPMIDMNFLHFAIFLFIQSITLIFVGSLLFRDKYASSWNIDLGQCVQESFSSKISIAAALGIIAIVALIWFTFSPLGFAR
jgi:solute:Na+ symporter, SSS family